jgi:hypothetical protein
MLIIQNLFFAVRIELELSRLYLPLLYTPLFTNKDPFLKYNCGRQISELILCIFDNITVTWKLNDTFTTTDSQRKN